MSFNKLKLKRSAVTGRYPTTASLDLGELAINTYDGKVFLKKDDGVQTIVQLADVSGSILSASYASTSSYSDQFRVAGTLTAQTLIVQTVSSSIIYSSGSNIFGNNLANTQIFTGSVSVTGSLNVRGGGITGSLDNLRGTATHIPYFSSSQVLANSAMLQSTNNFSIAINQDDVTAGAPEALYVFQPSTSSFNVISGKGNLNNYLQLNIQNTNQGISASSDVVATANNGNESSNYIDMGINSENFTGPVGDANDAYLYSTGQNLHIGNTTAGKHLGFFVGGYNHETDKKLQLNPTGHHQMTGSLDINSQVTASAFVTRGATAAQFVKGDGTLDSTNYLSSSVFFASSASLNLFTASINVATASLYRATASLYNFSSSILNFTSSQLVLNGKYATTGSNTFTGTQTITGSNGRLIYTGTTPGVLPTLAEIHANNDYPWLHRFYNDTFSTSSAVMAYYGHNDGRFVFHNESTQSIGLQVNGFNAENGLLVYSNKVAFVNNIEVSGSVNVYGGGFNVDGVNVLDTALAYAIALG
jgi:hypothetical protein